MTIFFALSPFFIVGLGTLLLMLSDALSKNKTGLALGAAVTCFAGTIACFGMWMLGVDHLEQAQSLSPWLVMSKYSLFFDGLICLGGGLAILLAGSYLPEHRIEQGEFYILMLLSVFGGMILASSGDVLTLFLGLETMSLGVYALTAFRRASLRSSEAAIKYFLLGSFAAALLLFGFALLYGATGHTDLSGMGRAISEKATHAQVGIARALYLLFGFALVLAGLMFKISAVPFHMWTPDAYEGAPMPTSSFMAAVVKTAAFAVLLRVLVACFYDQAFVSWGTGWPPLVATLAVITMTVANLVAARQESVKRMLAYSSIAHAGYALVGVVAASRMGLSKTGSEAGVLFYMLTYTLSTIGAFGSLLLCGRYKAEAVSFEDLAGIGRRHPTAAISFSFFLLSLAGIPPTAGFFGKWIVMKSALEGGFIWLAVLAFLNSVLGAYYYLKVLVYMYMREPVVGAPVAKPMRSSYVYVALGLSAALVALFGLMPETSLQLATEAAGSLRVEIDKN